MRIRAVLLFLIAGLVIAGPARAQGIEFPVPLGCPPAEDVRLGPEEEKTWNDCEKWAWSCISKGLEVNFFEKKCLVPRSDDANKLRKRYRYAPFHDPDQYASYNTLSKNFIFTILSNHEYAGAIPAMGIRLVGAYFDGTVNLENVTTDKNLVLDQSIFKNGLRLTNFKGERNLSLDGSNVRGRIYLQRASIGGTLFMDEGVYDLLDAADARFGGSIDGPGSIFNAPIRLDRVRVEGKVSLIRSRLTELTAFDTTIGSKLEMRFAHVRGRIDLTGTTINGDLRLQRLEFGRRRSDGGSVTCDWNLEDPTRQNAKDKFFLSPDRPEFEGQNEIYEAIIKNAVLERPVGVSGDQPCFNPPDTDAERFRSIQHEVLLRDMKIGGALCAIDLTGEITSSKDGSSATEDNLKLISLDGTEARTAIFRWRETESRTLWQAVHFKVKNLFIGLGTSPRRHFFDNLEIGNVSFLKPVPQEREQQELLEDSRNFLCEVPSGPESQYKPDAPETHDRIIAFFNDKANESQSAQPFAEIVKRLDSSGAASIRLKVAFSDFKHRSLCQSSDFFRRLEAERVERLDEMPRKMFNVARSLISQSRTDPVDEARRIGLDIACRPMLAAYKFSVSYGYEPLNILYIIVFFVMLFWGLLQLDEPLAGAFDGRPPRLGLLYAIDMFNPFAQVRISRQHADWTPRKRWLQVYLRFHRFVGFVLCLLLALGIYSAGTGVNL